MSPRFKQLSVFAIIAILLYNSRMKWIVETLKRLKEIKKMTKLATLKTRWLKDPQTKSHYQELSEEFRLAKALIQARDKAGLTQTQLAKRMRTTQSVVARMESGHYLPSLTSIIRYAKALGCEARISIDPSR